MESENRLFSKESWKIHQKDLRTEDKRNLLRNGLFRINDSPPWFEARLIWGELDWINWIDSHGRWVGVFE